MNPAGGPPGARRAAVEAARTVRTRAALEFLLEAAKDPAPEVRRAAAAALADRLEPIVLEPLLALLYDTDLDVRCAAARSLRRFKVDPRAVEALAGCLGDAPLPLVAATVESLGEDIPATALKGILGRLHDLGGRAAGRALVALARHAGAAVVPTLVGHYQRMSPEARPYLLEALGAAPSQPARDFLLRALGGPPAEAAAAARALGRAYADDETIDGLVDLLGHAERAVREAAAEALGAIARKGLDVAQRLVPALEKAVAKKPPPARPEAYRRLEKGDGPERRIWDAIVLLDRLDRPDLSRALAEAMKGAGRRPETEHLAGLDENAQALLREVLSLDAKWLRLQAATAFGVAADAVAERHKRRHRILGLAEALGRCGGEGAAAALAGLLGDPDIEVRATAARALGEAGDPAAVPHLLRALTDPEGRVRATAAWSLGRLGAGQARAPLVQSAADEDSWVRVNALLALLALGGDEAVEAARARIADAEPRVRATAARVLGALGGAGEIEALRGVLHDSDRRVRSNAAEALAEASRRLGRDGRDVVEALVDLLAADDNRVRATVAVALYPHAPDRARDTLLQMTGSTDRWMRASAAWGLAEIGTVEVVEPLTRLLADAEPRVRAHAVRGLARLGGPGAREAARAALASLGIARVADAAATAADEGMRAEAEALAEMARP